MSKIEEEIMEKVDTSSLFDKTIKSLVAGVAGIAASERKDLILSIGHIFQRVRSGSFLQISKQEWDQFKEKGRIKDDYEETDQHQDCLQEILEFLDRDSPDNIRFSFMKKLFLSIVTEKISDRDSILPQQYIKVCRSLSTGEILILSATYKIVLKKDWDSKKGIESKEQWISRIAKESGLKYTELLEIHEQSLINKNLLTPRQYQDRSGVRYGEYYRLTDLGYEICKHVGYYDELK